MRKDEAMRRIETLLSHVWMVRTFLKHDEEAADDEDVEDVYRTLYDYSMATGPSWQQQDAEAYVKQAKKKYSKLRGAMELFAEVQPEVSTHTNYQMAAASLKAAVEEIGQVLDSIDS